MTTDASDVPIGGLLSQQDETGKERLIYAYSQSLDSVQKNYGITDKELLAVVKSVEKLRRYLLGKKFILRTDHKELSYLRDAKNPTSRLLRWALKLQEYQFKIEYIRGEDNFADGVVDIALAKTK